MTVSAAEHSWPELLKMLVMLSTGRHVSDLDIVNLNDYDKTSLIRNDPVTCARYFNYKMAKLMILLKSQFGPFQNNWVIDSYQRVEFQQRGSPHEHIFLWCKDSPQYDGNDEKNNKVCIEFINKYITCRYEKDNPLMSLQRHRHTDTCYKGNKNLKICRFGYPLPVMPRTMILKPLEKNEKIEKVREDAIKIRKLMYSFFKRETNMSFDDILLKLNISENEYINAVRYKIDRDTVFLERNSLSVAVNCYNPTILSLFSSNMDLQFVLDPYSCASYIINYISKLEAGLSKLLKEAASDVKTAKLNIRQRLSKVANVFLNSNLMCAQEAAYHVLELPLSKCSRGCVFLNTSHSEERIYMLKSKEELKNMDPESNDIALSNVFSKYANRSNNLNNVCLADFATEYKSNSKHINKEAYEDTNFESEDYSKLKRKILRYRRYKLIQDEYNFYREQILLFLPWRNEKKEVENVDCKYLYEENINIINKNRKNII